MERIALTLFHPLHHSQIFDSSRLSFVKATESVLWTKMLSTIITGSGTTTIFLTCLTTTTSSNL